MKKGRLKNYVGRKEKVVLIKADKVEQIQAHAQAIVELPYEETDSEQVKTLLYLADFYNLSFSSTNISCDRILFVEMGKAIAICIVEYQ